MDAEIVSEEVRSPGKKTVLRADIDAGDPHRTIEEVGESSAAEESFTSVHLLHNEWHGQRPRPRRLGVRAVVGASLLFGGVLATLVLGPPWSRGGIQLRPPQDQSIPVIQQAEVAWNSKGPCHDAQIGEECYKAVTWGMSKGLEKHPKWYPGLDTSSSFVSFQDHLHKIANGRCPKPCNSSTAITRSQLKASTPPPTKLPIASKAPVGSSQCLCLFDVDRTLTGKQGLVSRCPGNTLYGGVRDYAFGGGILTLSALGQNIHSTFCGGCHLGIISAGDAGGPKMKEVLQVAMRTTAIWSHPMIIKSPFIIGCSDLQKPACAKGIVNWFQESKGIVIPAQEVYFFDDHTGNTAGFHALGYNARQISCATRDSDPHIGLCGGTPSEIIRAQGTFNCR